MLLVSYTQMWIMVPEGWTSGGEGREPELPEGTRKDGMDAWGTKGPKLEKVLVCSAGLSRVAWVFSIRRVYPIHHGDVLWADGVVVGGEYEHSGQRIRRGRKLEGGCLGNRYSVQESPPEGQLCLKKSFNFRLGWTVLLGHFNTILIFVPHFNT